MTGSVTCGSGLSVGLWYTPTVLLILYYTMQCQSNLEKHLHQFYVIVSIKHFVPLLCKFAARNAALIQ